MNTADFDYDLPPAYIAQKPLESRDASRLLVYSRSKNELIHSHFHSIGEYLSAGDLLVLNETRVIPARLFGKKIPTGGKVEILLIRLVEDNIWEALVGGKRIEEGLKIRIQEGPLGVVIKNLGGARRLIKFAESVSSFLERSGQIPLPPYIHVPLLEKERYQTIYARNPGSVAAPTAGLHFTEHLIDELSSQGILSTKITLHVGLDTFAPVTEDSPEQHSIHSEWCQVSVDATSLINQVHQSGKKIIAVGTTSVRTLESVCQAAIAGNIVADFEGLTNLFILPGYKFKVIDGMITNFHLPRSTLLMLVSAFAGRENILRVYQEAKNLSYRFYSFGDAMLIL